MRSFRFLCKKNVKFFRVILIICGTGLIYNTELFGQSDFEALKRYSVTRREILGSKKSVTRSYQTLPLFPLGIFYGLYRNVISEQISANCAFDLSCSRFSARAYSKMGFIKAGFLTFDRLTRCHPSISNETPPFLFNTKSGKVVDEPETY